MDRENEAPGAVDAYIAGFEAEPRKRLEAMRAAIREAAPEATERMAYGLPTFFQRGNLVHYGAFARHIGFYPTPSGMTAFDAELAPYGRAKGSVRFPHDRPLPLELVKRIVAFRLEENLRKAASGK